MFQATSYNVMCEVFYVATLVDKINVATLEKHILNEAATRKQTTESPWTPELKAG